MSLKRVLETLTGLGLRKPDAQLYVFLAKKGPHTGKDLCNALGKQKSQLYPCLRNLQNKQIINATKERPAIFSAIPFEGVLELLTTVKIEEARNAQRDKERALADWKLIREDA